MANRLSHFYHLASTARKLDLSPQDTVRWLWSYYASRISSTNHSNTVQIGLRNDRGEPLRAVIRTNGFDAGVLEEIFTERYHKIDLDNVRCILDLGGNIGMTALFMAQVFPEAQLCTVEPIPGNLKILKQNVDLNGVRTRIVAAAAGARDGSTQFQVTTDPRQNTSIGTGLSSAPTEETIDVQVLSVPSLMAMMGWSQLDILKIDVEGGEVEILGGRPEWLKSVRCIIGEGHHGAGYPIEAVKRDLEPMGFNVKVLHQLEGAVVFIAHRQAASRPS